MFKTVTPENAGISSENISDFIKALDERRLTTHSIIMARGNDIIAECHYEPFGRDTIHRMYSASKSFVAIAVGMAYTEGLLTLEDKILDHLPEYRQQIKDTLFEETTIRDMLSMQSNVASFVPWWGKYDDRIESYYAQGSSKIPGTVFFYDSVGSYLLGCIVEKLTGMTFLEYLKDRVLLKMGFSKESYTLYAPGGYTIGDSGVMCSAYDLLIFARLVLSKGEYNGTQYIDCEFMEQAISKQVDNDIENGALTWKSYGYGYLIWKTPDDGFAFVGMGDQIAICDVKNDFICVITSDNQSQEAVTREVIFGELYRSVVNKLSDGPLKSDDAAYEKLCQYIKGRKLICQYGSPDSPAADRINGVTYTLDTNKIGIESFKLSFENQGGVFEFVKDGEKRVLRFGTGENVLGEFPHNRRNLLVAGETGEGTYKSASSAAWVSENHFVIKSHIIDTYLGCVNIHFVFKDSRVTVQFKKSGQYLLDDFEGYAIGRAEQ